MMSACAVARAKMGIVGRERPRGAHEAPCTCTPRGHRGTVFSPKNVAAGSVSVKCYGPEPGATRGRSQVAASVPSQVALRARSGP